MRFAGRRRGLLVYQLVLILLAIAVIIAIVIVVRSRRAHAPTAATTQSASGAVVPAAAPAMEHGLPVMPVKPQPKEITFDGCPPQGDGRDAELNRLKNRVDDGAWVSVPFDSVESLPWPSTVERRARRQWSTADRKAVAKWEGIPVQIEGYLAGAKVEGPETPNCHGADSKYRDWHIWLSSTPGKDRRRAIVVETTPRVRASHPAWRIGTLQALARRGDRVRISGWLMLDPEHPDQVGKTRGTIWEIHPIMRIETRRGGRWVSLDGASTD